MDKSSYIAGEDIWFRAHLVEAQTHRPDTTSRYIYAELINPLKNIVHRVKVRNEEGAYSGYIPTAEDLPEGDYSVRFYTRYMEGLGDDYFFKRNIRIGSPLSGFYRTESTFNYKDEANIDIEIQFVELVNHSPIVPEKIRLTVGDGRVRHLKADPQGQLQLLLNMTHKRHPCFIWNMNIKEKRMHNIFLFLPLKIVLMLPFFRKEEFFLPTH